MPGLAQARVAPFVSSVPKWTARRLCLATTMTGGRCRGKSFQDKRQESRTDA